MESYFTVILPATNTLELHVKLPDGAWTNTIAAGAEHWYAHERTLSRGAFKTYDLAKQWAQENLGRSPYTITLITPEMHEKCLHCGAATVAGACVLPH